MGLSKQKARERFLFIKWNGNYCSTQMIAAVLVHPAVPLAKIASDVVSLYSAIVKLPVPVQFEQSFALLVQFPFNPVAVIFELGTVLRNGFVKGNVKIPLAVVVPTMVVPLDCLYSLLGFNTQSICSDVLQYNRHLYKQF